MGEVKHDGGPAFPMPASETSIGGHYEQLGMSLRDWFAGQFLCGQMSFSPRDSFEKLHMPDEVAERAYQFADAMIAARKATPSLHEGERG